MPDNVDLGQLYRGIRVDTQREEATQKSVQIQDPKYVLWCKKAHRKFPQFAKGDMYKKVKDAMLFLGWRLKPEEYNAFVMSVVVFGIAGAIFLMILVFFIYYFLNNYTAFTFPDIFTPGMVLLASFIVFFGIAGYAIYWAMNYPLVEAEKERRKSLAYLPSMVGYMTMYLKLMPNMEKAAIFAAQQGEGHLAEDLRKVIWDTNLGVYGNISEGLDYLAYRWKAYSMEFKEAIMMIKSAMVEDNEARRVELLDKTTENLLSAIKLKMEGYARSLSQPSLVLFYVGVLLPLLLVIILPIGSIFSKLPFANPYVLVILYDLAIPLFAFYYAKKILNKVPVLYKPPTIPDNFKDLPSKNNFKIGKTQLNIYLVIGIIFIVGILGSIYLQYQFGPTLEKVMKEDRLADKYIQNPNSYFEFLADNYIASSGKKIAKGSDEYLQVVDSQKLLYSLKADHDTTPYFIIYGFAIMLAIAVSLYAYLSAKDKKKVQDYYISMENDFREVLFILASRLAEGKPMETALRDTKDFFPDLVISQDLLAKTIDNINLLGLPLEQAFFDPLFGSLRNNPSLLIKNNMKIICDSSSLGVNTVAKTILSLSNQLKNIEDVKNLVAKITDDIKQMMGTMATFIAPAILGMVSSIQKIVILTMSSLASSGISQTVTSNSAAAIDIGGTSLNPTQLMGSLDPSIIGSIATPLQFSIILVINIVLIVLVLVYFVSKLESDNNLKMKMNMAQIVPIAVVVFVIASVGSSLLLGGMGG